MSTDVFASAAVSSGGRHPPTLKSCLCWSPPCGS